MAVLLWAAISEASPVKRPLAEDKSAVALPRQSSGSDTTSVDDDGAYFRVLFKHSLIRFI